MRILVTLGKALLGVGVFLGVTTMPEDFAGFLRRVAGMIAAGETVVLWSIAGTLIGWAAFDVYKLLREKRAQSGKRSLTASTTDYDEACMIANRYIDPDETMAALKLIAVRSQILARFDKVVGARVGDQYNRQLLHQWFQKNAARTLVAHQDEIT